MALQTHSPSPFGPTRWTLVQRARGETPEAQAALGELCAAYYEPVFQFLRREVRDEEAARELTHEFFERVLQHGQLGGADPGLGRFRSYLLGAVRHFLLDRRKFARREKRGGGAVPASLDALLSEGDVAGVAEEAAPPAAWFDRHWALAVMGRALAALAGEFERAGKTSQYHCLRPWLAGDAEELSLTGAARELGLSEGAVKVAIHRLRRRFRDLIRAEIRQTLAAGEDVDAELRYLREALRQRGHEAT